MRGANRKVLEGMAQVTDRLVEHLHLIDFSQPVTHVYNPLIYARSGYDRYLERYGATVKSIVMVGMNPGPFGMAQTGVPFGDVQKVTEWMAIRTHIGQPANPHPKRPISGFACRRGEVSGHRLWDWAAARYGSAEAFFERFIVLNYCPLVFMEASGRNRTPDRLPAKERKTLFRICDQALSDSIGIYQPQWVVGIGLFAEKRIREALEGMDLTVGRITHPSPANPKANRGWVPLIESELAAMGINLPPKKRNDRRLLSPTPDCR